MKNALLVSMLFFLVAACKQDRKNLLPDISKADSATVMFYKQPPNHRFFTIVKIKHVKELNAITQDVNAAVIQEKQECASWGKIYFYQGREAVQVVYFSPEQSCGIFSFILNGEKLVVPMSDASSKLLQAFKDRAVELPAATE
ncbi:MAG: hypothetical protein FJX94_02730 [Bacteroidetes bacterium]|nr:hypothetical protein [Bacteroidota bacterium]